MGIKRHIKKYKIILAAFIVAGITGCDVLHDDLDQCDLFLKFRYDYNMANKDWFAEQVEEVRFSCSIRKENIYRHLLIMAIR